MSRLIKGILVASLLGLAVTSVTGAQVVALDVTLIEAKTGRHIGQVLHTKRKGNGVRLFEQGGTFQLRISGTLARWTLKVQELTPEEAELYTPR